MTGSASPSACAQETRHDRYRAFLARSRGCPGDRLAERANAHELFNAISVAVEVSLELVEGALLILPAPVLAAALRPVLDLMQTVPPWVYLIPAVMIFSLGEVPAMLATVIYGVPPMLRITTLAFRKVPRELVELGAASGATPFQTLTKIEIPPARKTLLLGLNQCILLSLAMVVLAGLDGGWRPRGRGDAGPDPDGDGAWPSLGPCHRGRCHLSGPDFPRAAGITPRRRGTRPVHCGQRH